jgi:hypothetical protein
MKQWKTGKLLLPLLLLGFRLAAPDPLRADSSALILSSVPGDAERAERFNKWTEGLKTALVEKFGFSADRVVVLSDKQATRAAVQKQFAVLKDQLKPLDTFFLFFVGHGSYDPGAGYKFNLSGADLTASDYDSLLSTLPAGRTVIVNGTSSSGASIENLAGPNRVIVTATRSGQEGNETVFVEHFVKALEDSASDEDKDSKISVWEAFRYAAAGVERFYKEEGRLATEHPQISVNGSEKTGPTATELPALARSISFQVDRLITSNDPKLQALLNEKREIEQRIEALRTLKSAMPEAQYEKEMEGLLVQLALKNQQIREQEKKK